MDGFMYYTALLINNLLGHGKLVWPASYIVTLLGNNFDIRSGFIFCQDCLKFSCL